MQRQRGRMGSLIKSCMSIMVPVFLLLCLGCFESVATGFIREEIYVAGAADEWPIEFYDNTSKTYQGILPDLLYRVGEEVGVKIHYVNPSNQDRRLSMAQNVQVDVISTLHISEKDLERAGLKIGQTLLSVPDENESIDVAFAYTKSCSEESIEKLEEAFGAIDRTEIQSLFSKHARAEYKENNKVRSYFAGMTILFIGSLMALAVLYFLLSRNKAKTSRMIFEDAITGRGNFSLWKEKYEIYAVEERRQNYAVVYFYTGLEKISQMYGYVESNSVAKWISDLSITLINDEKEAFARVNEYYYIFLIQYTSMENLENRVRDIQDTIMEAFEENRTPYFIQMQAGISCLTNLDREPFEAIRRSSMALEYARANAKKNAIYSEVLEKQTVVDYVLENEIVYGLMNREFELFLQPIVDLESGSINAAEALVRWNSPSKGLLRPSAFLDIMEKRNLTEKMDMEMFWKGCRFLKQKSASDLRLLFNFTVENLANKKFAGSLQAIAERYCVSPKQIIIQLNHVAGTNRSQTFKDTIKELHKYGFEVCLSGLEFNHELLSYLDCGIDSVKIQSKLIRAVEKPEGEKVLRNLLKLCNDVCLKVLCIGVENKEQAGILKKLGAESASGNYFYYPISQDEFSNLLRKPQTNIFKQR